MSWLTIGSLGVDREREMEKERAGEGVGKKGRMEARRGEREGKEVKKRGEWSEGE